LPEIAAMAKGAKGAKGKPTGSAWTSWRHRLPCCRNRRAMLATLARAPPGAVRVAAPIRAARALLRVVEVRILYVENHAVFAATVAAQFLGAHAVSIVPSLDAAREAVHSGGFDVLLVDYDLDDGKGDVLVRELRATGSSVPIVAVSSRPEGNESMLRAGADAACAKASFSSIASVVARAIDHRRGT
jgi:CheY-like chemotaxis protein